MNLDLSKSNELFGADQTPTPTRLIKNCEEVGLFEDLRHVNPFDKSFSRAVAVLVEQENVPLSPEPEESLHTPQVLLPVTEKGEYASAPSQHTLNMPEVGIDMVTEEGFACSNTISAQLCAGKAAVVPPLQVSTPIQFIQPQLIALEADCSKPNKNNYPLILPKLPTNEYGKKTPSSSAITTSAGIQAYEHSSAHTPTSQLPIKERLKAILSQQSLRKQSAESLDLFTFPKCAKKSDGIMDRRRAAAARYRGKIRHELKELRRQNMELRAENSNLRQQLELISNNGIGSGPMTPVQLRIPPSNVHLVMNIPQLFITSSGQAIAQKPVSCKVSH